MSEEEFMNEAKKINMTDEEINSILEDKHKAESEGIVFIDLKHYLLPSAED